MKEAQDKKFDVVVVGELNVDLILNHLDSFPVVGKEILARDMTITLGSSSAIFASNLSTLGSSVTFIGKVGQDNFSEYITSYLKAKGVDTQNIMRMTEHSTGATIVLNFGEDRANVTYPGAMAHLVPTEISKDTLNKARHLHVSSLFLQNGLRKDIVHLFSIAKGLGLSTSLDPQWDPGEKWDVDWSGLLPLVDIFLPNAAELMAITRTSELDQALVAVERFPNITVIKNGSKGARLWGGKQWLLQPSFFNHDVVDSIGAGDSFDAGFIHAFLLKKPWGQCLEYGALMGAINTTCAGGTGAFQNFPLVKTIAYESFNYNL